MKRNSSLFDWRIIIIGTITGIATVIFNERAYTPMFGQVVLNNYLLIAASIILAAIGVFSRQLTQGRLGVIMTSAVGGAMIGIILVGFYYHWGQGLIAMLIPAWTYMFRKAVTGPMNKYIT